MTTRKKTQSHINPELQVYLDQIAAKYKPDPATQQRRIENAEARHNRFQKFTDNPARMIDTLQTLILEGWRFRLDTRMPVLSNMSMISVTLQKPDSLVAQELETLRANISEKYHNELFNAMEAEIDVLMSEAAEDAKRKAEEQVATDQSAMRNQLRNLLTGATV